MSRVRELDQGFFSALDTEVSRFLNDVSRIMKGKFKESVEVGPFEGNSVLRRALLKYSGGNKLSKPTMVVISCSQ